MRSLKDKIVLITGGTGSFGKYFTKELLENHSVKAVRILSRDELKQWEMKQTFSKQKNFKKLRFFLGDVRDRERLDRAFDGVDVVIHAAALKQVPAAEYNPTEVIKTNIYGAQNVISAALDNGVQRVIALSTDKASSPVNLYGATKLCSDKLFVAANNMKGERKIRLSVVRYGNVMGSRGSVIPFFLNEREKGVLPITDENMTRFNITLEQASNLVFSALKIMRGGEIFVPKIPSYKITDLAEAIAPNCKTKIVGIRPGEKIHEEMIPETESLRTMEFPKYFVILPPSEDNKLELAIKKLGGKKKRTMFRYSSDGNQKWLSVAQLRKLIKQHVDSNFDPQA